MSRARGRIGTANHPGWTATNLQKNSKLAEFFNRFFAQEPPAGVLPTLYAATAPDVGPNAYYGPSKSFETVGPPTVAKRTKAAEDDQAAQQLWAVSEKLTGVTYAIA